MTNIELLQNAIKSAPLSRTALAAAWGMSMPTFYSRISGRTEFTAPEIITATATLNLTKQQRDAIFFGE